MKPRTRSLILLLGTLSTVNSIENFTYVFPDCQNGLLKDNLVCNPTADYYERAKALISVMTLEEVIANVGTAYRKAAPGAPRLGLPAYEWWSEALHGVASSPGVVFATPGQPFDSATQFPNGINLGAAFDDELYADIGRVIVNETRAFSNAGLAGLTYYSPINVNPFRDPRWGRGQETPGEEPLLISHFARALVPALQGSDPLHLSILSTCKHYVAYDIEDWEGNERYGFDAKVSTQDLVEYYLPTFKACIRDAQGASLMTSYNAVNGIPTSTDSYLLETIARQRWGFDQYNNYVTSDCDAVGNVYDSHHYDASYAHAAAESINAGTDLNCGSTYWNYLGSAVEQKLTNETAVRQAATRMYGALVRLGYFDAPATQPLRQLGWSAVNTQFAKDLAYRSSLESVVLLKNDGLLPLSPSKYQTVAVVGPWANNTDDLGGIYSGRFPFSVAILGGVQSTYESVLYAQGTTMSGTSTSGFADALTAAASADVVIYAGGLNPALEREAGDRTSITWPGNQEDLITQLASVGKPLVVIQMGGGQVDNAALKSDERVNAILWGGYPGQSGAQAIADVLSGKQAPAGRLPLTQYPASYVDAVPMTDMSLRPSSTNPGRTYKWYTGNATYEFGHGLHYTTFSAKLKGDSGKSFDIQRVVSSSGKTHLDNKVFATIKAEVTNTGTKVSDYIAAIYVSSTNGPTPYPKRELVAYKRLHNIKPLQTVIANLPLTVGTISRIAVNGDMNLYPGTYTLTLDNPDQALGRTTIKLTGKTATIEKWA